MNDRTCYSMKCKFNSSLGFRLHGKERRDNCPSRDADSVKVGDTIVCNGLRATVATIHYQDYFDESGFNIEFTSTDGVYRSWKQNLDGGELIRFGAETGESFMFGK